MGNIFGDFEAKTTVLHSFRFVVYFSSMNHITKDHLQLKNIEKVVYTSTVGCVGLNKDTTPSNEDTPFNLLIICVVCS